MRHAPMAIQSHPPRSSRLPVFASRALDGENLGSSTRADAPPLEGRDLPRLAKYTKPSG